MMLFFYLLSFVVVLSVIVIAHEGGHFFAARRCGVQVEAFSVGFGKKLWSRKDKKGTEWRICAIPLGGYVQMLGDEDAASTKKTKRVLTEEEKKKTFFAQPVWKRAIIIFAGPFMNYVLAFVIFFLIYSIVGNYSTTVENVVPGSSAAAVGLQQGDVILAVDDLHVANFLHKEHVLRLHSEAEDKDVKIPAVATRVAEGSLAQAAGILEGDIILSVNDTPVADFEAFRNALKRESKTGQDLMLTIQRGDEVLTLVSQPLSKTGKNSKIGIVSKSSDHAKVSLLVQRGSEVLDLKGNLQAVIGDIVPDSLAEKSGLEKGDIILAVNDRVISDFDELTTEIALLAFGLPLKLQVKRGDEILNIVAGPLSEYEQTHNPKLGIVADESVDLVHEYYNPVQAMTEASKKVYEINYLLVLSLKKLISGGSNASELSGPVGIATASGDAAKNGPLTFISFVALLSLCVGFFNLLPVPVLDGGHLALLAYEAVVRKPLSEKVQNLLIRIGFSLLMALVVFTLFNDIPRVISRIFGL